MRLYSQSPRAPPRWPGQAAGPGQLRADARPGGSTRAPQPSDHLGPGNPRLDGLPGASPKLRKLDFRDTVVLTYFRDTETCSK
jgi:hypothetical protein